MPGRGALSLCFAVAFGCGGGPDSAETVTEATRHAAAPRGPLADPAAGVGADTCGACHSEIAAAQAMHPMARTAAAVTAGSRDRWFSEAMLARPVSWPEGFGPQPAYESEADRMMFRALSAEPAATRVDAVLGSGLRGMTPVSFAGGGRLRELRLSFSQARGGWIPTPGGEEDRDPLGDLDSPEESAACIGCHATATAWDEEGRFDPHRAVLGVTCERCHGSGLAHVKAQADGGDPGPIFHPGRLPPAEQVAFCGQCHRQPTDFEPREILARAPALARHAGASLMMSACFRESPSAAAIACLDCHDPHRAETVAPERTRSVCSRCHTDPTALHPRTVIRDRADCAGCHLPTEREAFHGTPFSDHWIRLPGEALSPDSAAGRAELAWLEELYRRRVVEEHPAAKAARLRAGLAELLHLRGARAEAQNLLRDALAGGPDYETRMKAGALLRAGGRTAEALAVFREAAAERPETPHAFYELGDLLLASGDFTGAVVPLTTAAALSPDSAGVRATLGAALLGAHRPQQAIAVLRESLTLEPDAPAALAPLAAILAADPRRDLRDPSEAVRLAERLARRFAFGEPRSLDLLAAALAAAGDFRGALEAGERAASLAERAGAADHAAAIRQRVALYRLRRPYVGPLPTNPGGGAR